MTSFPRLLQSQRTKVMAIFCSAVQARARVCAAHGGEEAVLVTHWWRPRGAEATSRPRSTRLLHRITADVETTHRDRRANTHTREWKTHINIMHLHFYVFTLTRVRWLWQSDRAVTLLWGMLSPASHPSVVAALQQWPLWCNLSGGTPHITLPPLRCLTYQ